MAGVLSYDQKKVVVHEVEKILKCSTMNECARPPDQYIFFERIGGERIVKNG